MFFLFSLLLILISVQSTLSCSCAPLPLKLEFVGTRFIFIGRVIDVKVINSEVKTDYDYYDLPVIRNHDYDEITMEIEESIKGVENRSRIAVRTPSRSSSCYRGSTVGQRWQMWGTVLELCSRSTQDITRDIDILRNLIQQSYDYTDYSNEMNVQEISNKDYFVNITIDEDNINKENSLNVYTEDDFHVIYSGKEKIDIS
ncbi:unnamed protein product [Adineta ricciae]|uniref:Uncharacterized protein n=1 Tax=Adineta ricciae TaxID=249248 RepID=A0A815MZS4_ADIRI|nr:unnamed protein product [Adineta ricciae]CAF1426561.1 unnamed protein product [Adineta ricciae]